VARAWGTLLGSRSASRIPPRPFWQFRRVLLRVQADFESRPHHGSVTPFDTLCRVFASPQSLASVLEAKRTP